MTDFPPLGMPHWRAQLRADGFALVPGAQMREAMGEVGSLRDWDEFAASWAQLEVDQWMADRAAYRRRRHAVFQLSVDGEFVQQPHQPHLQSLEYNPLHGDVARWFEPIAGAQLHSLSLHTILRSCHALFAPLATAPDGWKVEVHQFRIEARAGQAGLPTPEGVHRDGVDWVLVLLITRSNIVAGTTTIHDLQRAPIGSFTLALPFDTALVNDHRCFHGVTAVLPADPAQAAWRDVLVVTFKAC
jgi:hypothetical protein